MRVVKFLISVVISTVCLSSAAAMSDTQTRERRILVVGDSLSAAYNMSEAEGWVALLQSRLAEGPYSNWRVVNASVSGATTAAGLQVLPVVLDRHSPDICIIELGANDGLQGKPIPYIRNNLFRLVSSCADQGADVLLIGIRLPPNYGSAYTEPFFNIYAEIASEKQLAYVPFLLEGVAGNTELMMVDGIHPKAIAQSRVLENVYPVLQPLLSPK